MQRSARAQVVVSGCGRLRTSGSVADQESRSSVNKLEFVPLVEIMELDFDMGEDPISMEQALDIVVQSSEDLDMKLDDPGSPKLKQDENSRPKRTIPLKVPPARKKAREPSPSEVARSSDFSPSGFSPELSSAFGSALSLSEDRKKQAERSQKGKAPAPGYHCPYCDQSGLGEQELANHVVQRHPSSPRRRVCPICASQPGGDPNYKSQHLQGHMRVRHGAVAALPPVGLPTPVPRLVSPARAPRISTPAAALASHPGFVFQMLEGEEHGERVYSRRDNPLPRNLESLFEFLSATDNSSEAPCELCSGPFRENDSRAILPCGHCFHPDCLPSSDPNPACPICAPPVPMMPFSSEPSSLRFRAPKKRGQVRNTQGARKTQVRL